MVQRIDGDARLAAGGSVALRHRLGNILLTGCAAVLVAGIVAAFALFPQGIAVSADPGAPSMPTWTAIVPSVCGICLALVLPWRAPPMPAVPVDTGRLYATTAALLTLLVVFTLVTGLVPLGDEDYILGKFVLLMAVPGLLVLLVRPAVRLRVRRGAWRWWAPLAVIGIWFWLSQVAPWNPPYDPGPIDPVFLIVAATATAITAGIGEELFFRRWLQTRLEAVLGAWAGIAVTSVLFGLMHLGSHGTGEMLADLTRVIAVQGTFGVFLGVLWWRYRNLPLIIVTHLISNGWSVLTYLLAP